MRRDATTRLVCLVCVGLAAITLVNVTILRSSQLQRAYRHRPNRAELPESDRMPLTSAAKLAIEKAFPELQTAYVVERSAMAREQRDKVANGDTGACPPSPTPLSVSARPSLRWPPGS
jgi:hypothetical protein